MTYKDLKNKIKEEQKILALQIRRGKFLRKPDNRTNITKDDKKLFYSTYGFMCWKVEHLSWDYRHKHIAFCNMFYNTPYEKIESPKKNNHPDKKRLELHKKEWEGDLDETLHNSA